MEEGMEVRDLKTLSKIKSVEEMLPKTGKNQLCLKNPVIWENEYWIIEDCLKQDCSIEEACMYAGISVASYYKHRDKNPDFAIRMDRARQFPRMMARAAVMRRIAQWDSRTALRYLELRDRRYKEDMHEDETWSWKTKVEFTLVKTINEWADQPNNDSQTSTSVNSVSDWFATSWEKMTPRDNEEEALKRLNSLSFSNE